MLFEGASLTGKRVFVRADLNVPFESGTLADDYRLLTLLPTLDELISRNATVILGTHINRPTSIDPRFSTSQLLPWFKKRGYQVDLAPTIQDLDKSTSPIILLENLRFFPGEQSQNKQERKEFAHALAQQADYYVLDAFGILHRNDTSITGLPRMFKENQRALGYLVQAELKELDTLIHSAEHPFLLIIGGNKLSSKLPLVGALLTKVDKIAWCPAPVFTFLHVEGKPTGKSFIDHPATKEAKKLLKQAHNKDKQFLFPVDYQVAQDTTKGVLSYVTAEKFPSSAVGISIGPLTINYYSKIIAESKLIFYNGLMGMLNRPDTLKGVKDIFTAMAASKGTSIIAGGDSVAAARQLSITGIDYLSTGGGATLAYLAGETLPGLLLFKQ